MPHYETVTEAVEQEIKDHGLEHMLGRGRGVIRAERLAEQLDVERAPVSEVLRFIADEDEYQAGSGGYELMEALSSEKVDTQVILDALKKCSVRGAVQALLDTGSDRQQQYLVDVIAKYDDYIQHGVESKGYRRDGSYGAIGMEVAQPDAIRTGLWRDVVYASMIGTPELGALTMAGRYLRDKASREEEKEPDDRNQDIILGAGNLPVVRGYHSGIFPPALERRYEHYADGTYTLLPPELVGRVGDAFPELAQTYGQVRARISKKNPELADEWVEHRAVRELARIITKSTEYDDPHRSEQSPYHSGFAERLAWAQLGEQAQRQFRGMRRKLRGVDLHNIGRFIGKSGDNPYEKEWRKADKVNPADVQAVRSFYEDRARRESVASFGSGTHDPATHIQNLAAQLADIGRRPSEELLADFSHERDRLQAKRGAHASLAQKATYLHFIDRPEDGDALIDWINKAPFGLINLTHKMLMKGVGKETALAYAVARNTFPGESLTWELIDACKGITKHRMEKTQVLTDRLKEAGIVVDLENRLRLSGVSNSYDAKDVVELLKQGYSAEQVLEYPWLCRLASTEAVDFPAGGNEMQKHKWLVENGYAYLGGGWNKNSIGKLIYTRLQSGIEHSVHDASQWLETFQIPDKGYDVQTLKALVHSGAVTDISQIDKVRFRDGELEEKLIFGIINAPQDLRDRLLLPGKAQKIQSMLFEPQHQLLYLGLLDIYKTEDVSVAKLQQAALGHLDEFFDQWITNARTKETAHRINKEDLRQSILSLDIDRLHNLQLGAGETITGAIQKLNGYGQNRQRYIDDATSWLSRHMTAPHARLTKVWDDRATALAAGVGDSAREVEVWQNDNAARKYLLELERQGSMPHNLTVNEVMTEYKGWVNELSRVYGSERVVRAISEFKEIRKSESLLPAATIDLSEEVGSAYKAEILAADDPRGATIGPDTGCCMTLDGASRNCIKSGYRDKNAGFFALYTPEGRLAAQSYFYVNSNNPDVLVIDNIEANQGRDTTKIVKMYQKALKQYLSERFTSDSEWKIRTVQIGTGYGDAVKSTVTQLPMATVIRNNLGDHIYSDASRDQRMLLQLSDAEVHEAKARSLRAEQSEAVEPNHTPEIAVKDLSPEHAEIIRDLEKQIYPRHMRQYRDRAMLDEELHAKGANEFSFLVAANGDSSNDYLGYCLAYLEQSETDPQRSDPVLYAADMAIIPEAQGNRIGMKMFEGLLERAKSHGVDKIELHARETTSYAALSHSSWTPRLLYNYGYKLVDHGPVDEFDDNQGNVERLYLISLERI